MGAAAKEDTGKPRPSMKDTTTGTDKKPPDSSNAAKQGHIEDQVLLSRTS